ncbi:hypothetical protein B0H14DRAFT_3887111 [Mycena olivaceomarginata]|nr:hypothetical protein B0H14DRAFT_3887111 [Mycena olivaceomarginata]
MHSGSTIAARPAPSMTSSPARIVSSSRLSWIGSSRTSADATLDGWMLKGSREKGSWSYPRPPMFEHPSVAPVAPSSSAGQHDTERDALRDYKAIARLLDAPRAYDLTPDIVSRPHTHLTSAHQRYAAQPALSFFVACVALGGGDPRTAAGYATPLPSVEPAASTPHRTLVRSRHPPGTTISGTAPLSSSPDACSSRARGRRASPVHTTIAFSRIPPSPLGACASVHPQPAVRDDRRAQRPPRPFLLAGVPLVASALAATSSAPSHSKPASATQQEHDAQPQRRLQHLQHRLPIACVAFVASPHPATFLVRRAHYMRQSFPIPSTPFSASPHAATILAASGSKHRMRRTLDMHPHPLFPSPTSTAPATTVCVIPSSTQLTYAHFGAIRTAAACAPRSSGI